MRVQKINSTLPKLKKPLEPLKHTKDNLLHKCDEVRHKKIKDLSTKEIPFFGAAIGLVTPLPLGFLIGFGVGKIVEWTINAFKKKS